MKSAIKATFLALGLSISAFASQSSPLSNAGGELNPQYAGVSSCEITSSTGTSAVLCATGEGIVLDIFASSVTATDTLVMRDSATANTSSTPMLAITQSSVDKASRIYPRFKNGLSVNALVSPGTATGGTLRPNWTVVYTTKLK